MAQFNNILEQPYKQKGIDFSCEKKSGNLIFSFLLLFFLSFNVFGQTTIWFEDFESYGNGTQNGAGTGTSTATWSTNDGDVDIQDNGGSKVIRGQNTDNNNAAWTTATIDISSFTNVRFSLDADYGEIGQFESSADNFIIQYRINGGAWVEIENASGDTSPSEPIQPSYSVTGLTGNTLELNIIFDNTASNENYYIDNVLVEEDTPDQPPVLTAAGNEVLCPGLGNTQNIATSISITDPDDTTTDAVYIQISSGYVNGEDLLTLTGTHPSITASFDTTQGELTLQGSATFAEFEAAILDVLYSSSNSSATGTRQFSITPGTANYLPPTNHYYEFVTAPNITWTAANAAANARTLFGLQGYLATLTTQVEADFSGSQAIGVGWIGGSDATTEGDWRWVTGPEGLANAGTGTPFWSGGIGGTTTAPNFFAFWNTNEPNNSGNEDYAHITDVSVTTMPGSWNDLPNTTSTSGAYQAQGYVVEYGGTPGDPVLSISATTTITLACSADLSLTKTVDNTSPNVGDTIIFTITIDNNGPDSASGIQVRDVLPAGLINILAAPSVGIYNTGTGIWDLGSTMNSSTSETLIITAEITPQCGTITNTAEIINSSLTDLDSTPNNGG